MSGSAFKMTFSRALPIAIGVVLLVSFTAAQGLWSQRWTSTNLNLAKEWGARIDLVPLEIGDWKGTMKEADPHIMRQAGAVGHASRDYRNKTTGEVVSLYLMCGHSRDAGSAHAPDICYVRAGFTQVGDIEKYIFSAGGVENEFYTAVFRPDERQSGQLVRVFWSWSIDPRWTAPKYLKLQYGGLTALYKMYFITAVPTEDELPEKSPANQFAEQFLPIVTRTLFPPETTAEVAR